jgi:hypothetical protein
VHQPEPSIAVRQLLVLRNELLENMFTVRVNDDYLLALLHRDLPVSVRLVTVAIPRCSPDLNDAPASPPLVPFGGASYTALEEVPQCGFP